MSVRRLLSVAALAVAACNAPPPDGTPAGGGGGGASACATCGPAEICVEGACVVAPVERCRIEADPLCSDGTLCAVELDVLCPGDGCLPETACRAPTGARGGGYGCVASDECRSGACVDGLCVQLCISDAECDGLACLPVALPRGGEVRTCSPGDEAGARDATRPRCGGDTDCAGGQVCRRAVGDPFDPASLAFCAPVDEARSPARTWCSWGGSPRQPTETGTPEALAADATCQHGDCLASCGVSANELCARPRCAAPCDDTDDCPDRSICAVVPSALTPHARPYYICQPAPRGCYAEADCCPIRDAEGCLGSWEVEQTHCAPGLFDGRLLTTCALPEGRAAPGTACDTDAACGSGICLPTAPGGLSACSFVCDEFAPQTACGDATGVPGARCGEVLRTIEGAEVSVPVCVAP